MRSDRPLKSGGAERTFDRDLRDEAELVAALQPVIDAAWARIARAGVTGCTLTLKVKFDDFSVATRAASRARPIATRDEIAEAGTALLRGLLPVDRGIRLLGLTLSRLVDEGGEAAIQPALL